MRQAALVPPQIMAFPEEPELPPRRVADLPGIVSLGMDELFPDVPREIYLRGDDLSAVRRAADRTLAGVDLSMIRPDDTINLLCSEHGFSILEGGAYAEMLRTIKDVVEARTGCRNMRLRFCVGGAKWEAREIVPFYGLDEHFGGRIASCGPFDRGVPIETEIGTLYGLAKVYDADWIIHAHYDDPRELYFHHLMNRTLKAFTMSYARLETRSVYHKNFDSRSGNIVPQAIFDSDFVQSRFAFAAFLVTSPAGVIDIAADNDMQRLNQKLTANTLKSFGKLIRLFAEIDQCVAALDAGRWPWYLHAGGLTSGNLFMAPTDHLDLDVCPARNTGLKHVNRAVKVLLLNYSWKENMHGLAAFYPLVIAGRRLAEGLTFGAVKRARIAEDLEEALALAIEKAGTDQVIVFDGSYGGINLSPSMSEFLLARAPEVSRRVDEHYLPLWLKQRGIDPATV
ncbi:MAG: hypothetical protein KKB20_02465 [Proteobacteria bacterium]|nr:hypothetical protein [Pseudomonadota bacterium]